MTHEVPLIVENGKAYEVESLTPGERLNQGLKVLLIPNDASTRFIDENNAVGQLDLGIQESGLERGYPLIHIWSKEQM